jgi:bifunctional non-homologous end joining protein LigD
MDSRVKFDGYPQIVRDAEGVRIFTRRRLDWTSKYRDLAKAAAELEAETAIIDGEIIVLNGHDLLDIPLEDRREILAALIPDG